MVDEARNQQIVADVTESVREGRKPVVLTERREHLELLAEALSPVVQHLIVLKGGMGKKKLDAAMTQLATVPEDEARVVLATGRYLGEGFDDARLDTLFLTLPVSWRGTITQYVGRLCVLDSLVMSRSSVRSRPLAYRSGTGVSSGLEHCLAALGLLGLRGYPCSSALGRAPLAGVLLRDNRPAGAHPRLRSRLMRKRSICQASANTCAHPHLVACQCPCIVGARRSIYAFCGNDA